MAGTLQAADRALAGKTGDAAPGFQNMLAVVQTCSTSDVAANLSRVRALVARAATELRAQFVCLPECADYVGAEGEPHSLDGPVVAAYGDMARAHRVWLSVGGVHESLGAGRRGLVGVAGEAPAKPAPFQHNTHLVFDDRGALRAVYRKVHLFDAGYDGGWRESDSTRPGDRLVIVRGTPVGAVGLATCYDVRFPSVAQAYALAGADVILFPSAFMVTTGRAHWELLMRARAVEAQCYVAAAAQCGAHHAKRTSYGHSVVVDPFGRVLVDAGEAEREAVHAVRVDRAVLEEVRRAMPMADHIRAADRVLRVTANVVEAEETVASGGVSR